MIFVRTAKSEKKWKVKSVLFEDLKIDFPQIIKSTNQQKKDVECRILTIIESLKRSDALGASLLSTLYTFLYFVFCLYSLFFIQKILTPHSSGY